MKELSIGSIILMKRIGEPFTTSALLALGSRAAVDQALSRLARSGKILRIARGVYVRPRLSKYVGALIPTPEKVAEVVAGDSAITPQGAEAARRLGLTTQVPIKPVYYTAGQSRNIRIGKLSVQLVHRPPRRMMLAGRPAGIALSALLYLGREQVSRVNVESVERWLGPVEFQVLRNARQAMPAWLVDCLAKWGSQ